MGREGWGGRGGGGGEKRRRGGKERKGGGRKQCVINYQGSDYKYYENNRYSTNTHYTHLLSKMADST